MEKPDGLVSMKEVRAMVLEGFGINCECETEHALKVAGALPKRVHISELLDGTEKLRDYHILAMPGGFAYADMLGAATVWAAMMKQSVSDQLQSFIRNGRLVIGICNGFQALVKMGLLPAIDGNYERQAAALVANENGRFQDRWVYMRINPKSKCIFTKGIKTLYAPVRHGEGRFLPANDSVLAELVKNNQIVAQYVNEKGRTAGFPYNPNGSVNSIAGICDPTGRVFGLMPHPEAYNHRVSHPRWTREPLPQEGLGIAVFRNAVDYAREQM